MVEYMNVETIDGQKFQIPIGSRDRHWIKKMEMTWSQSRSDYVLMITFDDDSTKIETDHNQMEYWNWRWDWQNEKMGLQ